MKPRVTHLAFVLIELPREITFFGIRFYKSKLFRENHELTNSNGPKFKYGPSVIN